MSEASRAWLHSVGLSTVVSIVTFWGLGGAVHWWFYRHRRDDAARWKIQRRFLRPARARLAMWLGGGNILFGALVGGTLAWHVGRGGFSTLYVDSQRYGWWYLPVSLVACVAMMDAGLYYSHRALHHRALFRHVHRIHHLFVAPTVFTTLAMHPLEMATFMLFVFLPAFVLPMHAGVFVVAVAYTYLVGMIDHAGIRVRARFPFHTFGFHDDHHVYVHCNYGHHTDLWDRLHDTVHRGQRALGIDEDPLAADDT